MAALTGDAARGSALFGPSSVTNLRAIADELNAREMLTRRGGRWHISTVMNLLDRLGVREAACVSSG